jgi:hypothetical protein
MNEVLPDCARPTSAALPPCTFSQGSRDGPTPSSLPAGTQLDLFGPGHAPVNPSRKPAGARGKPTSGTSGRSFTASSASVALARSLANRLLDVTDTAGSMEYTLT